MGNSVNLIILIITSIIAVYGAVLSTLQILWKRKPNIKIKSGPSILSNEMPSNLYIRVENHGEKPVNITMPLFEIVEDGKYVYISQREYRPNIQYPYVLQSGQSFMVHIPMTKIINILAMYGYSEETEIFAVCRSELGEKYIGYFKINVSQMKKFVERISNETIADDVEGIW